MKKQTIMIIGGLIVALLCLGAFLFPIGDGLVRTTTSGIVEAFSGYDFIFTNDASEITKEATGGMIAAFVLLVIGTVFGVFGLLLPLTGSTKFSGFIDVISGLSLVVTGVLLFLATSLIPLPALANASYTLGYGFFIAAILAALGGVIELFIGFFGMIGRKQ